MQGAHCFLLAAKAFHRKELRPKAHDTNVTYATEMVLAKRARRVLRGATGAARSTPTAAIRGLLVIGPLQNCSRNNEISELTNHIVQ